MGREAAMQGRRSATASENSVLRNPSPGETFFLASCLPPRHCQTASWSKEGMAAVVEGMRRCASNAAAAVASVISAATVAATAAPLSCTLSPPLSQCAASHREQHARSSSGSAKGQYRVAGEAFHRVAQSQGAAPPPCRSLACHPPSLPACFAPQEEFRQNKEKLIEQETKKRMLEEMWQDRVSIAPEEQREIEREQQQQKEAVKALKRENEAQEALLHTKAKELETVLTSRAEVRRGPLLRQGLQWPRRTALRPMAVRPRVPPRRAIAADAPPRLCDGRPSTRGGKRRARCAPRCRTRRARSAERRSSSSSTRMRCSSRGVSWPSASARHRAAPATARSCSSGSSSCNPLCCMP